MRSCCTFPLHFSQRIGVSPVSYRASHRTCRPGRGLSSFSRSEFSHSSRQRAHLYRRTSHFLSRHAVIVYADFAPQPPRL